MTGSRDPGLAKATPRTEELPQLVIAAWDEYDSATAAGVACRDSVPILFFGDVSAYARSRVRVVTVGLNPSDREFPPPQPAKRFLASGQTEDLAKLRGHPGDYVAAMSEYFRLRPYTTWFNNYEWFLEGLGVSYYGTDVGTALHTDMCSPVATTPTFSSLEPDQKAGLLRGGVALWQQLIGALAPNVIVASIARDRLVNVPGIDTSTSKQVAVFHMKAGGGARSSPYEVIHFDLGGGCALIFGQASQTPFGSLHQGQRREAGHAVATALGLATGEESRQLGARAE